MESIRVAIRVRGSEDYHIDSLNSISCVSCRGNLIDIKSPDIRNKSNSFLFDAVYDDSKTQDEVFSDVKTLIDDSLNGKTYTMSGTQTNPGVMPRGLQLIFDTLNRETSKVGLVFLSYVELYNNFLYDLLTPPGTLTSPHLKLHEHPEQGVMITGSDTLRIPVHSYEETLNLINQGNKLRAVSTTNLNERSSRSHTIVTLDISIVNFLSFHTPSDGNCNASNNNSNYEPIRHKGRDGINTSTDSAPISKDAFTTTTSRINFVDLAGSERVKMSGVTGKALEEAKNINKALSALGDVLSSLAALYTVSRDGKNISSATSMVTNQYSCRGGGVGSGEQGLMHIPYRDSKLTMLLKNSLGGNAKTMMVTTIRSASSFYQQTLLSLRYAQRATFIKNIPVVNTSIFGQNGVKGNNTLNCNDSSIDNTLLLVEINNLKQQLFETSRNCIDMEKQLNELKEVRMASAAGGGESGGDRNNNYETKREEIKHSKNGQPTGFHNGKSGNDVSASYGALEGKLKQQINELKGKSLLERQHLQQRVEYLLSLQNEQESEKHVLMKNMSKYETIITEFELKRQATLMKEKKLRLRNEELQSKVTEYEKVIETLRKENKYLLYESSKWEKKYNTLSDRVNRYSKCGGSGSGRENDIRSDVIVTSASINGYEKEVERLWVTSEEVPETGSQIISRSENRMAAIVNSESSEEANMTENGKGNSRVQVCSKDFEMVYNDGRVSVEEEGNHKLQQTYTENAGPDIQCDLMADAPQSGTWDMWRQSQSSKHVNQDKKIYSVLDENDSMHDEKQVIAKHKEKYSLLQEIVTKLTEDLKLKEYRHEQERKRWIVELKECKFNAIMESRRNIHSQAHSNSLVVSDRDTSRRASDNIFSMQGKGVLSECNDVKILSVCKECDLTYEHISKIFLSHGSKKYTTDVHVSSSTATHLAMQSLPLQSCIDTDRTGNTESMHQTAELKLCLRNQQLRIYGEALMTKICDMHETCNGLRTYVQNVQRTLNKEHEDFEEYKLFKESEMEDLKDGISKLEHKCMRLSAENQQLLMKDKTMSDRCEDIMCLLREVQSYETEVHNKSSWWLSTDNQSMEIGKVMEQLRSYIESRIQNR